MILLLREITYSDKSKSRLLIMNRADGMVGSVKIQAKQWKQFEAMGVASESLTVDENGNVSKTPKP